MSSEDHHSRRAKDETRSREGSDHKRETERQLDRDADRHRSGRERSERGSERDRDRDRDRDRERDRERNRSDSRRDRDRDTRSSRQHSTDERSRDRDADRRRRRDESSESESTSGTESESESESDSKRSGKRDSKRKRRKDSESSSKDRKRKKRKSEKETSRSKSRKSSTDAAEVLEQRLEQLSGQYRQLTGTTANDAGDIDAAASTSSKPVIGPTMPSAQATSQPADYSPALAARGIGALRVEDGYFGKATEFRTWLFEKYGRYFEDLSSNRAHKYFAKFVSKWNKNKLPEQYYQGMTSSSMDNTVRTKYKWKFAQNINPDELQTVKDTVDTDTFQRAWTDMPIEKQRKARNPQPAIGVEDQSQQPLRRSTAGGYAERDLNWATGAGDDRAIRLAGGLGGGGSQPEDSFAAVRQQQQLDRRLRSQMRADLDELAPKPDPGSHQARMEKRRQKAGGGRDREMSPEMRDSDLYGGDDSANFKRRVAREREQRMRREENRAQRVAEYEEKERQRMEQFKKAMGLSDRFNTTSQ